MAMYFENTNSRRKDGRLAVQWHPSDAVLVTLDDNYSSDDEHVDRFQRSTWFGAFNDVTQDANGTISNFSFTGPTDLNANVDDSYIVTNTPGINVKWDVNDQLVGHAGCRSVRLQVKPEWRVDRGRCRRGLRQRHQQLHRWPGPQPQQQRAAVLERLRPEFRGIRFVGGQHHKLQRIESVHHRLACLSAGIQQNTDKIDNVKLEATWKTDDTKINFGMQFVDDLWNTHESDTFQNNEWQLWSGYGPASGNTVGVALPANLFSQVNFGQWLPGYSGASNLPATLVKFNAYSVLAYLETQPANKNPDGTSQFPDYHGGMPVLPLSNGSVQHVDRANFSPFITATQNVNLGDMKLVVNGGLRYQKTDETIAGISAPLTSVQWQSSGDPTAYFFPPGIPYLDESRQYVPLHPAITGSEPAGDAAAEGPSGRFTDVRCAA